MGDSSSYRSQGYSYSRDQSCTRGGQSSSSQRPLSEIPESSENRTSQQCDGRAFGGLYKTMTQVAADEKELEQQQISQERGPLSPQIWASTGRIDTPEKARKAEKKQREAPPLGPQIEVLPKKK